MNALGMCLTSRQYGCAHVPYRSREAEIEQSRNSTRYNTYNMFNKNVFIFPGSPTVDDYLLDGSESTHTLLVERSCSASSQGTQNTPTILE